MEQLSATKNLLEELFCPYCGEKLESFSGLEHIPPYYYCPKCVNAAYDEETGKPMFLLE